MGIGMTKVQHAKIPVSDLGHSVSWYAKLLDLVPFREFVEHGALRGAALRSPESGVVFALRERQFCASQPNLAGFDLIALHMASRQAMAGLAGKCNRLGIEHGPVQHRGPSEAVLDVPDPQAEVQRYPIDHFGPFRPEHQPAVATDASDFLRIRLDAVAHSLPGRK